MSSAYLSFGLSAALESAAQTGLVAALLQAPGSARELAARTRCDALAVGKLLDVLVAAQLLTREGDVYAVVARVRAELLNGPGGYAAFRALWAHTPEFVRSGARLSAMDGASGERAAAYRDTVGGLGSLFEPAARLLADSLPARERILDVGAGSGVWSLEMLRSNASSHATALDFEQVLPSFRARAEQLGLGSRVATLGGDFQRVDLARTFERVILANVLHLEDEEGARELLAKAAAALVPGGDLVIVDVLDCVGQDLGYAAYCLHLAMRTKGGVAHTSHKLRGWLQSAGLSRARVVDLSSELPALGALVAER